MRIKRAMDLMRYSLFIVYFWFGILKVLGLSPAEQLVQDLFYKTIPFIPFGTFLILFGIAECLIGIAFLIRGHEKVALGIAVLHLFTTALPLVLLPQTAWSAVLVPTISGQYIIKNLVLVSAAYALYIMKEEMLDLQKID